MFDSITACREKRFINFSIFSQSFTYAQEQNPCQCRLSCRVTLKSVMSNFFTRRVSGAVGRLREKIIGKNFGDWKSWHTFAVC